MRAVIVDDEPLARSRLQRLLGEVGINCVATGDNGRQAIELTEHYSPDFLFLDISMPVLDGMQAAETICEFDTPPSIILCTAHDEFAIDAFRINVAAYLLKPIFQDTLLAAIERASRLNKVQIDSALEQLAPVKHLNMRVAGGTDKVAVTEFTHFKAIEKHVFAVTKDGRELLINHTLRELEDKLEESVVCIYRGTLVIREHMTGLLRSSDGKTRIKLSTGTELEVSRRQLSVVKKCFE